MRRKIIPYKPILKKFARELRNNSTRSEIIVWQYLKGKQLFGYDFHRQKPIDNFIVDFYCCDLLLAIELDGITHHDEDVMEKDEIKDTRLKELGITLLRFEDEDVMEDIEWVIQEIEKTVWHLKFQTHP